MAIRIVLADDHRMIRDGLRALLDDEDGLEVVGEADTGRQAVELVRQCSPQIVVIDIDMPDLNGIEATRQIKAEFPRVKVIALSMHGDRKFISRMLQAGAQGYLLKDCAFDELGTAVRAVADDRTYLTEQVADQVVRDYVDRLSASDEAAATVLSAREREVLQLLVEGKTTKQAAEALFVSVKTIETHRKKMMDRLGISSMAELTKYAIREGLTSMDR